MIEILAYVVAAAPFVVAGVALLGALVDAKFLTQTREGAFVRLDGARPTQIAGLGKRNQNLAVA